MGGSNGRQKANESYLRTLAEQDRIAKEKALEVARAGTESGRRIERNALAVDDWQHSRGPNGEVVPIDVKNLPGGGPAIELYKQAQMMTDAGRVGRGTASMADGTNANYVASLDRENENDRKLFAQGQLEDSVNRTIAGKDAQLGYLDASGNNRNLAIAGLEQSGYNADSDRWLNYLIQRENRPSFLRTLSQSFAGSLGRTAGSAPAGVFGGGA